MPPDDYREDGGGSGCPNCRARQWCDQPGHGRKYIGIAPHGFRTDRCLVDWARTPFVIAVEEAYAWLRSEGGGFAVAYPQPSALLMRAVMRYASESAAREAQELESIREQPNPDPRAHHD